MLLNLLTSSLPQGYREASIPEAALYALIGFLVVFAGIAFLVFILWLVGEILKKAKTIAAEKSAKPSKPIEMPQAETVSPAKESDEVDEETIAVITAALMAFYQANNPKCEFTVKRIKRVRRNDYA
jgi:sodium pump decarboxylase gamma subunit